MSVLLKQQLHEVISARVNERIQLAREAMKFAQESANAEEKSSAGDKYETGRAMAQIERDKAAQQLDEALQLKSILDKINLHQKTDRASHGSLVITNHNSFYISISLGAVTLNAQSYYVISPQSPIGKILLNTKVNDVINFNHQQHTILEIL